jgi:hypothetical protein
MTTLVAEALVQQACARLMKALVYQGPGKKALEDHPLPKIATTAGSKHFDGIIDPAGWFNSAWSARCRHMVERSVDEIVFRRQRIYVRTDRQCYRHRLGQCCSASAHVGEHRLSDVLHVPRFGLCARLLHLQRRYL